MKKLILSLSALFISAQTAFAGGLTTTFGEVLVENLPLAKAYSMEKEAKQPLIIVNTSGQVITLKIELLAPQEPELKKGFEIIPDVNWIKVNKTEFTVEPGKSAKTDVIITVPDDPQYQGKKYQVFIWSHTTGKAVGVGLKSKLLLTVKNQE